MSAANRWRRQIRRNPARFLVDNLLAESPLQKTLRKRFQKKNWLSTYGKKKREQERGVDLGFDFASPGSVRGRAEPGKTDASGRLPGGED